MSLAHFGPSQSLKLVYLYGISDLSGLINTASNFFYSKRIFSTLFLLTVVGVFSISYPASYNGALSRSRVATCGIRSSIGHVLRGENT